MRKYRTERLKRWKKGGMNETVQVDFEAYLQWVIDTPNHRLNEHFAPIIELAQPCRVKYHFYGNFETYSSDVKTIISRLGTPQEWFVNRTSHEKGEETSNKMIPFYSTVRRDVKEKLIHRSKTSLMILNFTTPSILKKKAANTKSFCSLVKSVLWLL